ncbi:MAG: (2Fe-2S) ferredoxin domain-containing protein [Elusimicrobia bacterium]|nr:(2Fe-2S) ferredoxin domain-containing protein [Elusimicrobiota bacterium]
MEKKSVPYQKTVFVCANVRTDGREACANPGRGGAELCEALKKAVKDAGLKGKIRVAKSGCLDLCAHGPNLFVYPGGEWRSGVKPEDAPEILRDLLG